MLALFTFVADSAACTKTGRLRLEPASRIFTGNAQSNYWPKKGKKMNDGIFHDYSSLIAPVAAIINGLIAVVVAQFFKSTLWQKLLWLLRRDLLGREP